MYALFTCPNLLRFFAKVHVAPTGGRHVIVVEGPPDMVRSCWEAVRGVDGLPSAPLYNSRLTSREPLYGELGPGVHMFALERSVEKLLQDPHVYVRDGRGWGCLDGLSQLKQLTEDGMNMEDVCVTLAFLGFKQSYF